MLGQLDREPDREPGHVVGEVDEDPAPSLVRLLDGRRNGPWSGRGRGAGSMAGDGRCAGPGLELRGEQREHPRGVGGALEPGGPSRLGEGLERGVGERPQLGAPVHDDWQVGAQVDDEGHTGCSEVDDAVTIRSQGRSSGRESLGAP